MMRVRKMLPIDWFRLQMGNETFIWCIPPAEKEQVIRRTEKKIKHLGIGIKLIADEDREKILKNIDTWIGASRFFLHADMNRLSYPIDLTGRMFWLSKTIEREKTISVEQASNLLLFKFRYENEWGHEGMMGETNMEINSAELENMLFDVNSLRGTRMVDISIHKRTKIWVNIRFMERKLGPSNALALDAGVRIHEGVGRN